MKNGKRVVRCVLVGLLAVSGCVSDKSLENVEAEDIETIQSALTTAQRVLTFERVSATPAPVGLDLWTGLDRNHQLDDHPHGGREGASDREPLVGAASERDHRAGRRVHALDGDLQSARRRDGNGALGRRIVPVRRAVKGILNQQAGQKLLSRTSRNVWQTISVPLSTEFVTAISTAADLSVRLTINLPAGSTVIVALLSLRDRRRRRSRRTMQRHQRVQDRARVRGRQVRAAHCANQVKDGNETDVNCGGSCPPCPSGKGCQNPTDCASGLTCSNGICVGSHCTNQTKDADELGRRLRRRHLPALPRRQGLRRPHGLRHRSRLRHHERGLLRPGRAPSASAGRRPVAGGPGRERLRSARKPVRPELRLRDAVRPLRSEQQHLPAGRAVQAEPRQPAWHRVARRLCRPALSDRQSRAVRRRPRSC